MNGSEIARPESEEVASLDEPSYRKSLSPGETVFATGALKCGLTYEVVGLPAHHYALLIEGVRVWDVGGHVSVENALAAADLWDEDKQTTIGMLSDRLAAKIPLMKARLDEAQDWLDYHAWLKKNLERIGGR